ncbi:hypothetical protein GCM10011396_33660 [Undibacterium terreum]|uniref:Thoeris protein ThsB TIR-like domain-containing protein n=2 Tax=Undibacterium terreum TaxID=1224302 RepID=A0A916UQM4_9BURK|nr:hypothetical protein GCM10011396_33660 [Undibacterium terreum]
MGRCNGKTKVGRQCLNSATSGKEFCAVHKGQISSAEAMAFGAGALIGNSLMPGIGGMVFGGMAGSLARGFMKGNRMVKKSVFVSFDFDNDRALKEFILGQAKKEDSPFQITDYSLKEAAPEKDWESKANAAIGRSEIVLVMVGPKTYKAHGVLKEVAMARKAGVKIVQIIGYKNGEYTAVPDAGRLYAWNWDNLKKLLS